MLKINGITDIRDESDRDGMRIVIELKKDSNSELVISNLYKNDSANQFWCHIFSVNKRQTCPTKFKAISQLFS